jgi:DNA-binding NtrC family response regulator
VETFRKNASGIAAVLLDMTMPEMSGEDAFHEIRRIAPQARVIVSSGYSEAVAVRKFSTQGIAAFLQKPYTPVMLARVVKQVLS